MRALPLVLLLAACDEEPPPPCTDPPAPSAGFRGSVVLVVLDDIGVDKVGAYGVHDRPAPTPNLDALAASGVRFTAAYSQPFCSPARAAILTGRRAVRTGIGGNVGQYDGRSLPPAEITLPEALAELDGGWSTAAIGKWHLANVTAPHAPTAPLDQGFDRFDGILANPTTRTDGTHAGDYFQWEHDVDGVLSDSRGAYLLISQADAAIDALETLPEPFFLYVGMSGAHVPLHVPPSRLWSQANPVDDPGFGDAMIEATDHELGRILAAVGDRATVIVVGDNGTSGQIVRPPNEAHRAKGTLYPAGLHVPLIISGPGVAPGVSDALVHVSDLFPTVLDLGGLDAADLGVELDSRSLVPLLDGGESERRCLIVDRFTPNGDVHHQEDAVSVIEDGYQLVRKARGPDELYVLDPLSPVEGDDLLSGGPVPDEARAALHAMRVRLRHDDAR